MPQWNLYNTQPLLLHHPDFAYEDYIVLAAVSPYYVGIVFWNADYIISAHMPGGMPGSGFPTTPLDTAIAEYDEQTEEWRVFRPREKDRVYRISLPNERVLYLWKTYGKYTRSAEEYAKISAEWGK